MAHAAASGSSLRSTGGFLSPFCALAHCVSSLQPLCYPKNLCASQHPCVCYPCALCVLSLCPVCVTPVPCVCYPCTLCVLSLHPVCVIPVCVIPVPCVCYPCVCYRYTLCVLPLHLVCCSYTLFAPYSPALLHTVAVWTLYNPTWVPSTTCRVLTTMCGVPTACALCSSL